MEDPCMSSARTGILMWIGLLYSILLLPDDKQVVLLLSEFLSFLHETAPCDICNKLGPHSEMLKFLKFFYRISSQLLLDHCVYPMIVSADTIAHSVVSRSGISLIEISNAECNEDGQDIYRNIYSLR